MSNAQSLPLRDVVVRNVCVVGRVSSVAGKVGDDGHGFDTDDAFEGEIGLVPEFFIRGYPRESKTAQNLRKSTSKIIGGNLVSWDERFGNQVLRPLVEDLVVLAQIRRIARLLSIR